MDDTIIMDSVIQKYFAGETSEQEEKYLLAWLEESEEHRKYFFELKSLWGARRVFEESTDLSRFASFMRSTDHRIGSIVAGERSTRRRRLVRWTLGAAAAVLLAVCAGTAWHFLSTPDIYRVYENTGDAVTTVTLDDGTHVWLNARTKLTLPEAAPFVVSTDKLRVRVLGTSFCMQAYEGSQQAEVVLEHGSVRLQTPAGVNLVTLQPDQRALYDAADDNLAITQVNASHLVLTQYDLVTMSDATLHEIISHIETTFGVRLSVPGRYGDKRYTFNYQRSNSLEEVLNIVEYLTGEHCEVIYRKK